MQFLRSLRLDGFLSFPLGSEEIPLTPLNVLIGPNGSGKSNLIESIELLHATPTAFAAAIRDGGGAAEWLSKSAKEKKGPATIEVTVCGSPPVPELRYRLAFTAAGQRTEVSDEVIERTTKLPRMKDVFFYYRFQQGHPVINIGNSTKPSTGTKRHLERQSLAPDESVLSQRKDPDQYPELTWLGQQFNRIQTFREWSFGRYAEVRKPQPADLPTDSLLPDARNLGLILNRLEHSDSGPELVRLLTKFLPRFTRYSTRVEGNTVQFYLHEEGLRSPVPATRLSDGTIRFVALLAVLLSPAPPPLVCIEEPELGLHPDALGILADLMVEASQRMQIVVSTHSDALVSALSEHANSVLVCEYLRGTTVRRVDPTVLTNWLANYTLGDIWRRGELGGNL